MILVVDDFADTREVMSKLLRMRGYPCEVAASGPEALAFIRSHTPEEPLLVVLDSMMPGVSGVDTLKEIRSDPKIRHTTVLIYSAGFNLALRDEALTLGAAAWVLKGSEAGFEEICHWYERIGGVAVNRPIESHDHFEPHTPDHPGV